MSTPTPAWGEASTISSVIVSVPAPPLIVSNAVRVSVAKKVKLSSPVPPSSDKLPAALADIVKAVDSESPVAVDALIVEAAPGWITKPALAAKKASFTVNVEPVVNDSTSTLLMLTTSAADSIFW